MGYFSNGSEGSDWEAQWCRRCVHKHDENSPCPVLLAHWTYNYELCNKKDEPGKAILDLLIPMTAGGFPDQCALFFQKDSP
jgi:hypothetical protein